MRLELALLVVVAACGPHHLDDIGDGGVDHDAPACTGPSCPAVCPAGTHTTVSGVVYAPNGTLPLYNAVVSIPTTALDPFVPGVSCDRCDSPLTGNPTAMTNSLADGSFQLVDVPDGTDIPLVVQLGHWRREVKLPVVHPCTDNAVVDPDLTRLPRDQTEGDIPQMAIATGAADPFECLLLKLGLDPSEITDPSAGGRVHFYTATDSPGTDLATPAPSASVLYSSLESLSKYDVVLLPCEGGPHDKSEVNGQALPADPRKLLSQYVDLGGRVFTTHYSYDWLTYDGSIYNQLAAPVNGSGEWPVEQPDEFNNTIEAQISVTFPKGVAFAEWLQAAGATSPWDKLDIVQGRHDITGVSPEFARPWATFDFSAVDSGPGVMHFTFNTPLDPPLDVNGQPEYCGRVVYSDFHVTTDDLANASLPFPAACNSDPMTDQEKALVFMLFDLSSCVTNELE